MCPKHEAAWLERALSLPYRDLALEVRNSKPGAAPRDPKDKLGLPQTRFPISVRLASLPFKQWELAKKKASDARGTPVDDGSLMSLLAGIFLSMEPDGTVEGWKKVDSCLYRIVARQGPKGRDDLTVEADLGPAPIDASALPADTPTLTVGENDGPPAPGSPTPSWLRALILARDGDHCRCCRSRRGLMVHHIRHRKDGGPTVAWNLLTVCSICHSLIHAGLLVLQGEREDAVRFLDSEGNPIERTSCEPVEGMKLCPPERREREDAPPPPAPFTIEGVPEVADLAWWRRHAHLFKFQGDKGLSLEPGTPIPAGLLGTSVAVLARSVEPILVHRGLVRVTPRGRAANPTPSRETRRGSSAPRRIPRRISAAARARLRALFEPR